MEIITARDVRRALAFRQQTVEEGADFDELFTGIDNTARKRDFGGTLVNDREKPSPHRNLKQFMEAQLCVVLAA